MLRADRTRALCAKNAGGHAEQMNWRTNDAHVRKCALFTDRAMLHVDRIRALCAKIVSGLLVEFAFAPPGATAGRQYRKAWRNLRRANARSTSSDSHPPGIARAICVTALAMALARGEWSPKQPTPCKKHSPCIGRLLLDYPPSIGDGSGQRRVATQTTDHVQRHTRRASLQAPSRKC